ncbi:TOM1-like protein 2, partial [Operophtera brumata]
GVGQIYAELKQKGVEFPMTDLDMMAPIFTPQRAQVTLSESQSSKLRADLSVVEGNMAVMSDMLNELTAQPHAAHHHSDIELLNVSQSSKLRADLSVVEGNMAVMSDMLNELTAQPHAAHHHSDIELLNVSQSSKLRADLSVVGNMAVMSDMLNELTAQPHAAHHHSDIELLNVSQSSKLRADLSVVEGNMAVMSDMLNELTAQPHAAHLHSDIELLNVSQSSKLRADLSVVEGNMAGVGQIYAELKQKGVEFPMTDLDMMAPIFTPQRSSKLRADLSVVEGNMAVMSDMLNELTAQPHAVHHHSNIELLNVSQSSKLRADLSVVEGNMAPEEDALIDLSDDVPDVAQLSVQDAPRPARSPGASSKDEFDMFAQSRNLTYDTSKTGYPTGMDQREIDEIAAWLEQEKFLAERAAAAENLPNAGDTRGQTPQQTPRHRQIKKEDPDSMFAL